MDPKVTVLTTVYNTNLDHLRECVESILNQTYKDFKFLIIDDASPDKRVFDFLKSFQDPRIFLLKNEKNLGVSDTINKALSLTDSKYIIRADHDDVSFPKRIEEQVKFLEKNPHLSAICSWEITIDELGKKSRSWEINIENYGDFLGPILLGICPIWHPSLAFKREDIIEIGGFNKNYVRAEDWEVTTRLALKRYEAGIIPEYLLYQRNHSSNQSNTFTKEMNEVNKKVHREVLSNFLSDEEANELLGFLRLEKSKVFNKEFLIYRYNLLSKLLTNVQESQSLNDKELSRIKKTIFQRLGLGVNLMKQYSFLPNFFFMCTFYLLSPLYIRPLYEILSNSYQYLRKIKYILFFNKLDP